MSRKLSMTNYELQKQVEKSLCDSFIFFNLPICQYSAIRVNLNMEVEAVSEISAKELHVRFLLVIFHLVFLNLF